MISEKLKLLRKEKSISQQEVADAIGVTKSAYSNYEQGIREPSFDILKKLCKYFCVTSDYMLGLED